ncbi:MAG: succinylglutamate desuccinylase/aspartoacylase family protein [Methylocystaceae bacterium]
MRQKKQYYLALILVTAFCLVSVINAPAQAASSYNIATSNSTYQTKVYVIDSGVAGPTVMVVGGVHGNETAGYRAAGQVKDFTVKKGRLIVIPEAHKPAIARKSRTYNGNDLNRDFPQGSTQSADSYIAREIYQVVKNYDVDYLVDLHEGYDYYKSSSSTSVGQSIIYYPRNDGKTIANKVASNLNLSISSSYRQFSVLRYPVGGSLARASGQYLGVTSFIFETSQKQDLDTRIKQQLKAVNTILGYLNMK